MIDRNGMGVIFCTLKQKDLLWLRRKKKISSRYYQINYKIKADKLRVINATGENLGVITKDEALRIAKESNLDLVVISPNTDPQVAKILDFTKFLYDEKKKRSGFKGKKSELKELRFGPNTGEGDIQRHITRAQEFIDDGDRVKFNVVMKGREQMFPELAFEKLNRIIDELSEIAKPEAEPRRQGNSVYVIMVPK